MEPIKIHPLPRKRLVGIRPTATLGSERRFSLREWGKSAFAGTNSFGWPTCSTTVTPNTVELPAGSSLHSQGNARSYGAALAWTGHQSARRAEWADEVADAYHLAVGILLKLSDLLLAAGFCPQVRAVPFVYCPKSPNKMGRYRRTTCCPAATGTQLGIGPHFARGQQEGLAPVYAAC